MLTVIENVLDAPNFRKMREALDSAQWTDGSATAGSVSQTVKHNEQLREDDPLAIDFGNHILRALGSHPLFLSAALPEKIYPPKFNRYAGGGTYGAHVDSAVMRVNAANMTLRSDLSATLFLTPPEEYDGGELVIETQYGAQAVKLNAGDMVLYPSTSLHEVTPVTRGARVSSFFWIQSMVRETERRTLLFDLDQSIQDLTGDLDPNDPRLVNLIGVYNNLMRGWAVV